MKHLGDVLIQPSTLKFREGLFIPTYRYRRGYYHKGESKTFLDIIVVPSPVLPNNILYIIFPN